MTIQGYNFLDNIWIYLPCKNLINIKVKPMSLNTIYNDMDPNNNIDSHFEIPTKYQPLDGIDNLIPMGRFFNIIIDVDYWYHAFTYITIQHGMYSYEMWANSIGEQNPFKTCLMQSPNLIVLLEIDCKPQYNVINTKCYTQHYLSFLVIFLGDL